MDLVTDTLKMSDKFELTGFSYKPFYQLSSQEATALGAKQQKDLIFFKGVLIKADVPNKDGAIVSSEWVRKKKDKWVALPVTLGHPDFKNNVAMNGRSEQEIIKDLLKFQENFAIGRMMKVEENPSDPKLMDFYGYIDNPDVVKGVKTGEVVLPRYGSPYFWQLGDISSSNFDKDGHFLIDDHEPVHWAFTNHPKMGAEIEVKAMCTGEQMQCMQKMQSNSYSLDDDTDWNRPVCPCKMLKEGFDINVGLDKSFYVDDPLSSLNLKMSSNSQTQDQAGQQNPDIAKKNDEIVKFMSGVQQQNKNGSMPPSDDKSGGESGTPNPGEHVDRDKQAADAKTDEKKPEEESQDEKTKMEAMIEEVRAKAEKSVTKKYEKTLAEKDGEIAKLQKQISELTFKDIQTVINDSLPDELFGAKEEDKTKAQQKRDFYTKLAKDKNLSKEEVEEILNTNTVSKQLVIDVASKNNSTKKAQANSEIATNDDITKAVQQFSLSDKTTTNLLIQDTKTTPDQKKEQDDKIKKFLNF